MGVWGILFRDERGKNAQALLDFEITRAKREEILIELEVENYSEGPLDEKLYQGANMWVFGKMVKGKEVYIKITMGFQGAQVLCISFHLAERKMSYPYKTNNI